MLKTIFHLLIWLVILVFIIFYPLLISIDVYLPLLIGFAGYMIVLGIEGRGFLYILLPAIYYINLEVNLSLSLMLLLLSVILFYMTLYKKILFFKRCPICVNVLSVIAINLYYFISILGYDSIFDTTSVSVNYTLLYSVLVDIFLVLFI